MGESMGDPQRRYALLYIEDNLANMALVKAIIERRNDMSFLTAIDGDLGLLMARSMLPDVILMDINLPGRSGYEVLNLLRADPVTAHIPVVALSSNAFQRDIDKGIEAGFLRYITKPYRLEDLTEALERALHIIQQ